MDGVAYVYTVSDIMIYDSTDSFRLPAIAGKSLVLATCYPFRYSGHAPGKIVLIAECA
jgi:sortase (surface protein transpeptidase)